MSTKDTHARTHPRNGGLLYSKKRRKKKKKILKDVAAICDAMRFSRVYTAHDDL